MTGLSNRRSWISLGLVVVMVACRPNEPQTPPPTAGPTTAAGSTATAADVSTTPCPRLPLASVHVETSAAPPQPAPGADGEETDVDQGRLRPIPVDPNGAFIDLGDLPVAPAPGAQTDPQPTDLTVYGAGSTLLRGESIATAEPNVAIKGGRMFMTWNRFAAVSHDLGATVEYLYPMSRDQNGELIDGGFCCDQLVEYVARYDLWLWIMQYEAGADGRNRIRVAVARGDAGFDQHDFRFIDLDPQAAGLGPGLTYDQAKVGTSDENVYLSINASNTGGLITGAAVIRLPLQDLANGEEVSPTCYVAQTPEGDSMDSLYPVRRAGPTMYLASHWNNATLAVWSWPDSAPAPSYHLVRDANGGGGYVSFPGHWEWDGSQWQPRNYSCPRTGAQEPADTDWCGRPSRSGGSSNDERITTGWLSNGQIGFAWNARQLPPNQPYPWVFGLTIDESRLGDCASGGCVTSYPTLAFSDTAVQYAAIAPNAAGDLGGVVLTGGGSRNLACTVMVHDALTAGKWDTYDAATSLVYPGHTSGDYLGIWPDGGSVNTWTAGCMTSNFGEIDTAIHFLRFGRRSNDPGI